MSGSDSEEEKIYTTLEVRQPVEYSTPLEAEVESSNNLSTIMSNGCSQDLTECLESGDNKDVINEVMNELEDSLLDSTKNESYLGKYQMSFDSRQAHNQKERMRRLRMKCSCEALRQLVPGISDKTDKASVLEHAVNFLAHLSQCTGVKCDDYLPPNPPPMSVKVMQSYPNLSSGDYQYYQIISAEEEKLQSFEIRLNDCQIAEQMEEMSACTEPVIDDNDSNVTQTVPTEEPIYSQL